MIVEICLTMAVSSSCCEWGFSSLSRLKTEFRNSLNVQTVDHLLNICLNGPSPEQFVAEKTIIHWLQDTQRASRPNFGNVYIQFHLLGNTCHTCISSYFALLLHTLIIYSLHLMLMLML